MTNPNNAIGTNAAYDGRTSVEAFNDVMNMLSRGIISGWECVPNSGLTVSLGGNGTVRDVAAAQDAAGNKTSINNRSGSPVNITMAAAPASNTRIDAIVAYVESSPTGSSTTTDNPAPCGIIPVSGTPSSSPVAPNESAIRTAITADGASGTTAFYVVLAYITIPAGTTDLTATNIAAGPYVQINAPAILPDNSVTANKIDFTTLPGNYSTTEQNTGYTWIDGKPIYKKTVAGRTAGSNAVTFPGLLPSDATLVKGEGVIRNNNFQIALPFFSGNTDYCRFYVVNGEFAVLFGDIYKNGATFDVTLYYVKSS